ncbi:Retrovirus-related Pol polyprotein from transposon TNT 1-94, partial [Sesbania bispinosa]
MTETVPRLQLDWEEIDSGREATQGIVNAEQQIVNNRPTRNKNFPSRFSYYQLYSDNAISGDGDLVQHLALMAD